MMASLILVIILVTVAVTVGAMFLVPWLWHHVHIGWVK